MSELGIKITGPFRDVTGISQVNRELALALYNNGINVNIVDLKDFSNFKIELNPEESQKLNIMEQIKLNIPYVHLNMYPPTRYFNLRDTKAKANVFWHLYETDRIPYVWKLLLSQDWVNEVWVPSEFNKETFTKSNLPREFVKVVNFGVDTKKYNPNNEKLFIKNKDNFYFSFISELKLSKGYDLLLRAFYEEFANEPKAKLLFKCSCVDDKEINQKIVNMIASYKNNSKAEVILMTGTQSEEYMRKLYATADCFVLPSRGEGWGLGLIQSMASGVPVITSNCSAQTTFCNKNNSALIDAPTEKIRNIEWLLQMPIWDGHFWCEPNYLQLKMSMRFAFENRELIKAKGLEARKDVEAFDWNNIVVQVVQAIKKFN